jgi:hypothetical protein
MFGWFKRQKPSRCWWLGNILDGTFSPNEVRVLQEEWAKAPPPSTAIQAASILGTAADTLRDRDAIYKASDKLYSAVMAAMFPDGVRLETSRDHHRFHLFMLAMVKVTRYARNWEEGHTDSLIDLAAYAGMLAAVDRGVGRVAPGNGEVPS